MIFDSLSGGAIISRQRTISVIRDYLSCEHQSKFGTTDFDKYSIKGHCVKVPQQDNLTDCGLFVLQYVEHFFKVLHYLKMLFLVEYSYHLELNFS